MSSFLEKKSLGQQSKEEYFADLDGAADKYLYESQKEVIDSVLAFVKDQIQEAARKGCRDFYALAGDGMLEAPRVAGKNGPLDLSIGISISQFLQKVLQNVGFDKAEVCYIHDRKLNKEKSPLFNIYKFGLR
eukprot:gene681-265_t